MNMPPLPQCLLYIEEIEKHYKVNKDKKKNGNNIFKPK